MKTQTVSLHQETHTLITFQSEAFKATILSYGATLVDLQTPNVKGEFESIVIRYQTLEDYLKNTKLLGSTVGPYAGRIWPASMTINKKTWLLDARENTPFLHSEAANLARKPFVVETLGETFVTLKTTHPSLKAGYPGNLDIWVTYRFEGDVMTIETAVQSDEDTYVNLAHHSYFNLSGNLKHDITHHRLTLPAASVYRLRENGSPEAKIPVKDTPFDFQEASVLETSLSQLKNSHTKGLDHPFMLQGDEPIVLEDPMSKRSLSIRTSYDSVVVYSNNHLSDHVFYPAEKDRLHLGICLETQHLPNDVHMLENPPSFCPANTLNVQHTHYRFSLNTKTTEVA